MFMIVHENFILLSYFHYKTINSYFASVSTLNKLIQLRKTTT